MRRISLGLVLFFAPLVALPATDPAHTVSLVLNPAPGPPTQHGAAALEAALRRQGWYVERIASSDAATGAVTLTAHIEKGGVPESLVVKKTTDHGKIRLDLAGADDRGLMYALLDTAERIGWTNNAADPFNEVRDIAEKPTVLDRTLSVYTMNRAYWESRFYDVHYWTRYFDTLAASRFNRFMIVFGYENAGFMAPPYPYFFDTPGYAGVHMIDLTPEQQKQNLAALNRLIGLAHDRGIAVTLGIWDHIYRGAVQAGHAEWLADYRDRPVPNTVVGVTGDNLTAYTLAALKELLVRVPAVDALQFRVHEESGLKRSEMDAFWREVFSRVQKERPGMLIEARGKGMPDSLVDTAVALGANFRIETKFWMEQMGLPFHPMHINPDDQKNRRHGYADFLRYPQRYRMVWRLWNGGTTRILLWGDPDYVRRYAEATSLYDSPNLDVQEPLATKMEAQRPDLPPFDLMPAQYRYYDYEFERYWEFFKVWGRVSYNPATPDEFFGHEFERRFGMAAASHVQAGLQRASQVLPMLVASSCYPYSLFPTTVGWAERLSLGPTLAGYARNTGTDTQLFESFDAAARRILAGGVTPQRTPDATAHWLDATADVILAEIRAAEEAPDLRHGNEFDSTVTDLKILAQLARFHARRSIAAIHYDLFKNGHRPAELVAATRSEAEAVAAWRELVTDVGDRYDFNLAMGAREFSLCGHWRDELMLLETDLQEMKDQCRSFDESAAKEQIWTPPTTRDREPPRVEHTRIETATPGQPLRITARVTDSFGVKSVTLRYRHVTQFEDYETLEMKAVPGTDGEYAATVPGDFIVPQWDFMYFIETIDEAGNGTMWPDFLKEAPYVFVKLARPDRLPSR